MTGRTFYGDEVSKDARKIQISIYVPEEKLSGLLLG